MVRTSNVKLKRGCLVGNRNWPAGVTLRISKHRADDIVKAGLGEPAPDDAKAIGDVVLDRPVDTWTAGDYEGFETLAGMHLGFDTHDLFVAELVRLGEIEEEERRRKGGRPRKERDEVTVKIDGELARRVKLVATDRGIEPPDYLIAALKDVTDRDIAELGRKLLGQ